MGILTSGILAQADDRPGFFDNEVLDEFTVPFGEWFAQMVFWINSNLDPLLQVFKAPFSFLMWLVVNNRTFSILTAPWILVVLFISFIAYLSRNAQVAVFVGLALTLCGLLGPQHWDETAKTLGMIFVAVLLCAVIGIPLGILSGRFDAVWNVIRPTLDAMQVVHSFVYMLPVVFFFGIGEVSATMVTMVFAIPPLIRLTNLGIRQVPEDVVEASRAFGAPELRVLTDVQLPLARPAIMTGLNQTLLLSISMLGIAAIMGAGGLGLLVFRAINNLNTGLAASAGLALFLVAVVLDRISQREGDEDGQLLSRIRRAWAARNNPEVLLEDATDDAGSPEPLRQAAKVRLADLTSGERTGLSVAVVGGVIAIASVFLTWNEDAGWISGFARRDDETLAGMAFNGFAASGGSWYGFTAIGLGAFIIIASIVTIMKPGKVARFLSADGVAIAGMGVTISSASFLVAQPSWLIETISQGPGPLVATIGGAIAAIGGIMATFAAPYAPRRPLPDKVAFSRIFGGFVAMALVVIASFSGWSFDERADVIITPEIRAEIDRLEAEAGDDPTLQAANAQLIANLANGARQDDVVLDGWNDQGAELGLPSIIAAALGLLVVLPGAGLLGRANEQRIWAYNVVVAAVGLGTALIGANWIFTTARVADSNWFSGVGSFLVLVAGVLLIMSARSTIVEFDRRKVYGDEPTIDLADDLVEPEPEKVLADA